MSPSTISVDASDVVDTLIPKLRLWIVGEVRNGISGGGDVRCRVGDIGRQPSASSSKVENLQRNALGLQTPKLSPYLCCLRICFASVHRMRLEQTLVGMRV